MTKSIISNEPECLVCKSTLSLARHHVFAGNPNRQISEKYGCWVYLCGYHHNLSNHGVHYDKSLDLSIKQLTQRKWESLNGNREDFIKTFGRSYL